MIKKFSIIILFLFILTEIGLRLSGKLKTYTEQNFKVYQSPYKPYNNKQLFTFDKNTEANSNSLEFKYSYKTNNYGFVFPTNKTIDKENTFMVLGDSFTFGVGAPKIAVWLFY